MNRRRLQGGFTAATFTALAIVLLVALGVAMGDFRFQASRTYRAILTDSSGLRAGDDVRAAGVTVGKIEAVGLQGDGTVKATFTTSTDVPVASNAVATIRYKNLTGDMFLDLTKGAGAGQPLPDGGTLPIAQTRPALDLDDLFNGFKPLLRGLEPEQVNELTSSLLAVFDGQSASVNTLLSDVASFTGALADQDKVIGQVIDNLDGVLSTLDDRRAQVADLVTNLDKVVRGLARDRSAIGSSLVRLNELAASGAGFLRAVRPELKATTQQLQRFSAALNTDLPFLDKSLTLLPSALNAVGRIAAYGSFYNLYLCGLSVSLTDKSGTTVQGPVVYDNTARCQFQPGQKP